MSVTPQLSHYIGHSIAEIRELDDKTEVVLSSGVVLTEYTPNAFPTDVSGLTLTMLVLDVNKSMFYVGTPDAPRQFVLTFTPLTYMISDPRFDEGEAVNPQLDEDPRKVRDLPDEPVDRLWEGNENNDD